MTTEQRLEHRCFVARCMRIAKLNPEMTWREIIEQVKGES